MTTSIYSALNSILQDCDGATSNDGKGFNGIDAGFARSISAFYCDRGFITGKMTIAVLKMLKKYRKQLASKGIDYYCLRADVEKTVKPRFVCDVVLTVGIIKETEKAFFVNAKIANGHLQCWLPKSVVNIVTTGKRFSTYNTFENFGEIVCKNLVTKSATLLIPKWLYQKNLDGCRDI